MTRRNYTLMEMIFGIAILGFLLNAAALLFVDGSKLCNDAIRDADMNRTLFILRNEWRDFTKRCEGDFEMSDDGVLLCGANFAKFDDGRLILSANGGEKSFVLSSGLKAALSVEKPDFSAGYIVLDLSDGKKFKRRIVSAYEKK